MGVSITRHAQSGDGLEGNQGYGMMLDDWTTGMMWTRRGYVRRVRVAASDIEFMDECTESNGFSKVDAKRNALPS